MTPQEKEAARHSAIWYQEDAAYLALSARGYRERGNKYIAKIMQENSAQTAAKARNYMEQAA